MAALLERFLWKNRYLRELLADTEIVGQIRSAYPVYFSPRRCYGDGFLLVGDAARVTEPVTGEGIYFALKSAEILAQTIESPHQYPGKVWNEIGVELERASRMYKRFYNGRFLAGDFKKRTVQLSQRSRTLRTILGNLIAGNQSYVGLKKKLFFSIPSIGIDLITGR